jgi:hypothetical protein
VDLWGAGVDAGFGAAAGSLKPERFNAAAVRDGCRLKADIVSINMIAGQPTFKGLQRLAVKEPE